jgi:hypothetical protein
MNNILLSHATLRIDVPVSSHILFPTCLVCQPKRTKNSKMQGYLWTGKKKKKNKKRKESTQRLKAEPVRTCMHFHEPSLYLYQLPTKQAAKFRTLGSKKEQKEYAGMCNESEITLSVRKGTMYVCCCVALITIHTLQEYKKKKEMEGFVVSNEYPLAAPLDEFIQHHSHVS